MPSLAILHFSSSKYTSWCLGVIINKATHNFPLRPFPFSSSGTFLEICCHWCQQVATGGTCVKEMPEGEGYRHTRRENIRISSVLFELVLEHYTISDAAISHPNGGYSYWRHKQIIWGVNYKTIMLVLAQDSSKAQGSSIHKHGHMGIDSAKITNR